MLLHPPGLALASLAPINGYTPVLHVPANVLSVEAAATEVDDRLFNDPPSALGAYTIRMQWLSTDYTPMQNEQYYQLYSTYYQDPTYADTFITNCIQGANEFSSFSQPILALGAQNLILLLSVWMRVVHEMDAALAKPNCTMAVFDNAWAMYSGPTPANLLYSHANSLCAYFSTCSASGVARVNVDVFGQFLDAQVSGKQSICNVDDRVFIVQLMTVPLVQGLMWAVQTYLDAQVGSAASDSARMLAYTYGLALLPQIARCDSGMARDLVANMALNGSAPFASGLEPLTQALRNIYPCLGILCSDIGAFPGQPQCADAHDISNVLASYTPKFDTAQIKFMDMDMNDFNNSVFSGDFASAQQVYVNGRDYNPSNPDGTVVSFQQFAIAYRPTYDLDFAQQIRYWQEYGTGLASRANDFVSAALDPQQSMYRDAAQFHTLTAQSRAAAAYYGVLAQIVALQAARYVADALNTCQQGVQMDQAGQMWDQGYNMYSGGMVGPYGNITSFLLYDFAKLKAAEFGTMSDHPSYSKIHTKLLAEFAAGQVALAAGDCDGLSQHANKIYGYIKVPLVQGLISATLRAQATSYGSPQRAEAWAFAVALLPGLAQCSGSSAATLRAGLDMSVPTSFDATRLVRAVQIFYQCLQVTCEDVGSTYANEGCVDQTVTPLPAPALAPAAVAGIVIVCLFLYFLSMAGCFAYGRAAGLRRAQMDQQTDTFHVADVKGGTQPRPSGGWSDVKLKRPPSGELQEVEVV
jgi:hypothetical protein